MASDSKNFRVSEYTCHCGCGYNVIDQRVIDMCQEIRDELGSAVRVNSGCRCERHNARVGGVKGSNHTLGLAADISCEKGALELYLCVYRCWLRGKLPELRWCCIYPRKGFVHIDCGKVRSVMWSINI